MGSARRLWAAGVALLVAMLVLLLGLPLFVLATGTSAAPATGTANGAIPARVLRAYRAVDGWCPGLRWQLVAGLGFEESGHGTSGGAAAGPETWEVTPPIFGIPLDGSPGIPALPIREGLRGFGAAPRGPRKDGRTQ